MKVRASFLAVAVALPLLVLAVTAPPAFAGGGHGLGVQHPER